MIIGAGNFALVKTDIKVKIPEMHYGRIAPRSGLTLKYGLNIGAGVIDSDYRGTVGVIIFNHGSADFVVGVGDRIAQLIIERISIPQIKVVSSLDDSSRGAGGFGSTGTS
jgi:dUTP pyrophosphatase